jgi:hypothetical protein
MEGYVRRRVLDSIPQIEFDLVFVDSGELVGPRLVRELKSQFTCRIMTCAELGGRSYAHCIARQRKGHAEL